MEDGTQIAAKAIIISWFRIVNKNITWSLWKCAMPFMEYKNFNDSRKTRSEAQIQLDRTWSDWRASANLSWMTPPLHKQRRRLEFPHMHSGWRGTTPLCHVPGLNVNGHCNLIRANKCAEHVDIRTNTTTILIHRRKIKNKSLWAASKWLQRAGAQLIITILCRPWLSYLMQESSWPSRCRDEHPAKYKYAPVCVAFDAINTQRPPAARPTVRKTLSLVRSLPPRTDRERVSCFCVHTPDIGSTVHLCEKRSRSWHCAKKNGMHALTESV